MNIRNINRIHWFISMKICRCLTIKVRCWAPIIWPKMFLKPATPFLHHHPRSQIWIPAIFEELILQLGTIVINQYCNAQLVSFWMAPLITFCYQLAYWIVERVFILQKATTSREVWFISRPFVSDVHAHEPNFAAKSVPWIMVSVEWEVYSDCCVQSKGFLDQF